MKSKNLAFGVFLSTLMFLNACSTGYGPSNPPGRAIPTIPEISHPVVRRTPAVTAKKSVKPIAKVYTPKVKKYSVNKTAEPVILQKEVASVLSEEDRVKLAQKNATVEFDPYAVIPEGKSSPQKLVISSTSSTLPSSSRSISMTTGQKPISSTKTSPAVTSLMLQAKGELAIGNTQSAVSKLERALRIESQNPSLWNLLARANFDQSNYQQAITMAKKSIRYSRNEDLIGQNWTLIKNAGEKSGDTLVVKEALNYFKVNP